MKDNVQMCFAQLLAVKPQHAYIAAEALTAPPSGWIISVIAGVSMGSLKEAYKTNNIVRCMPNTPAIVLEAMTVWTSFRECPPDIKKKVKQLLAFMGEELYVTDESYIDMATAVSGSGPAVRNSNMMSSNCSNIL
jgi:pyrroline-5-carboxylate reductase